MRYLIIILLFASCSKKYTCNCEIIDKSTGYPIGMQSNVFEYKKKSDYRKDECIEYGYSKANSTHVYECHGQPK